MPARSHGLTNTRLYYVWASMKARCLNPLHRAYKDYGGRGIQICEKWLQCEGFVEDMSSTYAPGLELDRIDNDGPYCKDNCRWTDRRMNNSNTRKQQNRNYPVGVYRVGDRYRAAITIDRKFIGLGTFDTSEQASQAYQNAVREINDQSFSQKC